MFFSKIKIQYLILCLVLLILFGCNSLYNGKVKLELANFKRQKYHKKGNYNYPPDYYFVSNTNKNTTLSVIYIEHPDGYYTREIVTEIAKEENNRKLEVINKKAFVVTTAAHRDFIDVTLVTGFKKGYIMFIFKGKNAKELEKIYSTIKIKK